MLIGIWRSRIIPDRRFDRWPRRSKPPATWSDTSPANIQSLKFFELKSNWALPPQSIVFMVRPEMFRERDGSTCWWGLWWSRVVPDRRFDRWPRQSKPPAARSETSPANINKIRQVQNQKPDNLWYAMEVTGIRYDMRFRSSLKCTSVQKVKNT